MTTLDPSRPYNALFLRTRNSARSIITEAIMNRVGAQKFNAYSAGSYPKGEIHPQARALLKRPGDDTAHFCSKPWDEFAGPAALDLHFAVTVCDNVAGEVCPAWPGQPITAHSGMHDPAEASGPESAAALAFVDTYRMLNQRISIFTSLPIAKLARLALKRQLDDIGESTPSPEPA